MFHAGLLCFLFLLLFVPGSGAATNLWSPGFDTGKTDKTRLLSGFLSSGSGSFYLEASVLCCLSTHPRRLNPSVQEISYFGG
jgi:hypothetical protein